jgi:SAM-dependent methyltransferase
VTSGTLDASPAIVLRRADYRASLVRSDYFVVRALGRFIEQALREHVRSGALVADVGCGEQPWRQLVEELGARYLGADLQQNAAGSVAFRCVADALPLGPGTVDVAVCTEVLEHVPDPGGVIGELMRILKPGGTAVVTTPFLYPLHEEPWDFQRLTRYQIERAARHAGFAVERLEVGGNEIEVLATMWDRLWSNALPAPRGAVRTGVLALLRASGNLAAVPLTAFLGGRLPKQAYLCNLAVLRAAGEAP